MIYARSSFITMLVLSACVVSVLIAAAPVAVVADAPPPSAPQVIDLPNPLGIKPGPDYVAQVVGSRVIKPVLGVVGSLALLMFVYGGFEWLTSGGSPDKIKKGRDVTMWAAIGIVIILSSYVMLQFVINALTSKP